MNADKIYLLLLKNNSNYSVIAEALETSPSHIRNVSERLFTSRRVATAIAAAINKPFDEVFPDYQNKKSRVRVKDRSAQVKALKKKLAKQIA